MASNSFIIDDREHGTFRVNRAVFTDPAIMAREQQRIFENCWLYVGHESEIPKAGDFRTRRVAGRPIIMSRGSDGKVRVLLNTCTHRGAMVCRHNAGNAKTFQCFYHAWTFDNQGRLVGVPGEDAYGPGFERQKLGLGQPARTESYRGFVFSSFNPELEPLPQYLAGARDYLDIVVDQGEPEGLEIVAGSQDYCMQANWKLLVENSFDGYHSPTTHTRYLTQLLPDLGITPASITVQGRGLGVGNGHGAIDAKARVVTDEALRPMWEARFGATRAARLVEDAQNLLIFPNLMVINTWRTIRTFFPVAPNQVEVSAWALMPKRDTREVRRARLDHFLAFLGPGGFATPDDAEALECCQRAFGTQDEIQWSDISRGATKAQPAANDEEQMRSFWRRWNELMTV